MRILLLILFFSGLHFSLSAQPFEEVKMDTSSINVRSINAAALKKIKASKDFQYIQMQEPPKSLWDRFWSWFWWNIEQLFKTRNGRITIWTVLSLVALVIIGFFVWKVMGMNKEGLFARRTEGGLDYAIGEDDIHNISFDEAIQAAINSGNYRQAIRLLYLQSLKTLSDKAFIDWQINKTNSDYLIEVKERPWNSLFRSLTHSFEYTWYGEMAIEKDDFVNMQAQFQQLKNQLL